MSAPLPAPLVPTPPLPPAPRIARCVLAASLLLALAGCGATPSAPPPGPAAPEAAPPRAGPASEPPAAPAPAPAAGGSDPGPSPDRPIDPVPGAPPADGDEPPPPAGADLPSRTTARSSADATHTLADVPVLRAVRTGVQPDADRLVFEFDGDGLPAWSIEYVDRPQYECGSGEAVRLRGDAWLQIRFIGAAAHTEAGAGTSGPRRRTVEQENLLELARICDFEGEVTWIAAVARPDGYTPRVLASPARLVVDIAR